MRLSILIVYFYVFISFFTFSSSFFEKGILDFEKIENKKSRIIELSGEWQYFDYEIDYLKGIENNNFIMIPNIKKSKEKSEADKNFTIALNIKSLKPSTYYAIEIPYIYADYKLKINDKITAYQYSPKKRLFTKSKYVEFYNEKDNVEIVLQLFPVSGYKAGLKNSINFGERKEILFKRDFYMILNFGVIIFLIFSIMYYLYVKHKNIGKDYISYIIFLTFFGIIFQIMNFEFIEMDYILRQKSKYILVLFMIYFLFSFFIKFFNIKTKNKKIKSMVFIITFLNLIIPYKVAIYWDIIFVVYLIFFLYLIFFNLLSVLKNKKNSIPNLASYFLILIFAVSNYKYYCSPVCFNFAVLTFAVMQFFIFARRNYNIIKEAEIIANDNKKMIEHIEYLNNNFEKEIKERTKNLEQKNLILEKIAKTDGLTGVYNHKHIHEILENEFKRAKRYRKKLSVLMIDIDYFKNVNDNYGHQIGDRILVNISEIIKRTVRETDVVGRYGGEEFIAVCCETDVEGAYILAERIRTNIEKLKFTENNLSVTVSIGLAELNEEKEPKKLVEKADKLLYEAKKSGRNRTER